MITQAYPDRVLAPKPVTDESWRRCHVCGVEYTYTYSMGGFRPFRADNSHKDGKPACWEVGEAGYRP